MEEFVAKALAKRDQPRDVEDLFEHCKNLVETSRNQMCKYYDEWDNASMLVKSRRPLDEQDRRSKERKEPVKMVVPLTGSQVDTFVSFCYMLFTQRENVFELAGTGIEDTRAARIAQALLERDLNKSNFRGSILLQWLRNVAKFNLGVIKHSWFEDVTYEEQQVAIPSVDMELGSLGIDVPQAMETQLVPIVTWAGNKLIHVSPYRFFPDPRFPISRFQEGEFCASEDDYSPSRMKQFERDGLVAGVEFVDGLTDALVRHRRVSFMEPGASVMTNEALAQNFILSEVELELIPAEQTIDGTPLGKETFPVKFLVWYANDQRIVRIERQGYAHNNFLYRVGQYTIDDDEYIGQSLPDLLDKIQDAVSWFINSRITSIRKVIDNRLIVDPRGIDVQALKNRDPVLLLKPSAQGGDVRRFVQQLQVQDVTGSNLTDVSTLSALAKEATGLSENLLGQYAGGRRSATEARQVNANATARIKKICDSLWYTTLQPLAEDLVANHRAFLDVRQLIKVVGDLNAMDPGMQQAIAQFISVSKEDIQGNFDFTVYDGTLPSEKERNAQGLQELLQILMNAPQLLQALGFDIQSLGDLLKEILTLRGIKNVERFSAITRNIGPGGQPGQSALGGAPAPTDQGQPVGDALMQGVGGGGTEQPF